LSKDAEREAIKRAVEESLQNLPKATLLINEQSLNGLIIFDKNYSDEKTNLYTSFFFRFIEHTSAGHPQSTHGRVHRHVVP
jgi:hypothetical protein